MLRVLKAEPGVAHPRLETAMEGGRLHVALEYDPSEQARWIQPTCFYSQSPGDPFPGPTGTYTFVAVLPGLGPPDFHVTKSLVAKWRTQCDVNAIMLFA